MLIRYVWAARDFDGDYEYAFLFTCPPFLDGDRWTCAKGIDCFDSIPVRKLDRLLGIETKAGEVYKLRFVIEKVVE